MRSTVNTELLVSHNIFGFGQLVIGLHIFGPESNVRDKYAGSWVLLPKEWGKRIALTAHDKDLHLLLGSLARST